MQWKIIRIGNSYGIILPKNILKIMDWDVHSLEVIVDTAKQQLMVKKKK